MSWRECELGDVVTLKRGHDLPKDKRKEGAIPVVSSSGITGWHNESKADPPGVVTGRYGTIGEVFFVDRPYWPLNTALYAIDFHDNDPRFVSYFLRNQLKNYRSEKAAVPGVDRNVLHKIKVRAPDLPTQERIAAILSAYDDLIENNRRRIALLEQAARLLYREWFVHFRFPGHETARFKDGLPEGWVRQQLGDVCATNKNAYKKGKLPSEVRYIDIGAVSTGHIEGATHYLAEDAPGRARRIAEPMDTIWSNVRPNLKAYALVMSPNENDVFSTGFTVLHAETVSPFFLYFTVTTDDFVKHLMNHATGVSYPAVRADDFERAEVLVPIDELMTKFHQFAEPMFQQMIKLSSQNAKLTAARDLVLPRLMDGRIPVSV